MKAAIKAVRTTATAADFHHTEGRKGINVDLLAVLGEEFLRPLKQFFFAGISAQVDKIDGNNATNVAQSNLAGNDFEGLHIDC